MRLDKIKPNPDNPRVLRDGKFKKLVASLREFPEMMEKRPIVVDEVGIILGGNMRYRALQDIYGKKGEIPDEWVTVADGWTDEQKREFVVKDNSSFGEWDWDALANEWDAQQLADWGIDFPEDWANGDNSKEAAELEARQRAARQARNARRAERDTAVASSNGLRRIASGERVLSGSSVFSKSGDTYTVVQRKGDIFTLRDKNGRVFTLHKSKVYLK